MSGLSVAVSPLLPWAAIVVFAVVAVLVLAFGAWRRARGPMAAAGGGGAAADPGRSVARGGAARGRSTTSPRWWSTIAEHAHRRPPQIRRRRAQAVPDKLNAAQGSRRARRPCRRARPDAALADNGTELYTALTRALSDVPASASPARS